MSFNQSGPDSSIRVGNSFAFGCNQSNTTTNITNATIIQNLDGASGVGVDEQRIQKLRDKLKPMTVPEQEANRPKCLQNTRVDLLKQIRSWASVIDKPNIFLLTGAAGTGKSTVARTIAEEFEMEGKLGCYIFFQRGKAGLQSSITSTVIRTIAYNLARTNSVIAECILAVVTGDVESIFASTEIMFKRLLHEPLLLATEKGLCDPILFVLDALDECGPREVQKKLATLIRDKISKLPSVSRFLVTSRPEEGINPLSRVFVPPFCNRGILDHTSASSKEDVIKFVHHEMRELKEDGAWHIPKDWPWDENMRVLGEAADGVFIWASTAIKYISRKKSEQFQTLKALVENSGTVNKGLSSLYATVLESSLDWDDIQKERFLRIFSFILFSKRLLTNGEIDDILDLDEGTTRDILSCLQSLVTFEGGKPIRIHHASLYDYLISADSENRNWHIDEERGKTEIALCCFDLMFKRLRFNICNLGTSFAMNDDVLHLQDSVHENIPPSLQYVCLNWALHLQDIPYSEGLSGYLYYFAYETLLYWVEVLSLIGNLYTCLGPSLEIAIKWINDKNPNLSSFLEDARKQLIKLNEPLSQSTPHIYMTFLPLMKEESIVAYHYAARFSGLTRVEHIGDKPKEACIKQIDVGSAVYSVSYSPDGKYIVSGSKENVCIWDAVNGGLIFGPFGGESYSVTFSNDGKYVASGNDDGTIGIWNAATGESIHGALVGHTGLVYSVAFSPDSKYIISGSFDDTVQIWDVEKGMAIGEPLQGYSDSGHSILDSVLFSPSGIYFASSSCNEIIIRDIGSRGMKYPPLISQSVVCSLAFSHNSSKIVSGTRRGTLNVWDVSEGIILSEFSGFGVSSVFSVTYSLDDKYILSGFTDGVLRMFDAEDSEISPRLFRGHTSFVKSVSYTPDGRRFISGSYDQTIRIWDVEGGQLMKHFGLMMTATVSIDGKYLVSGWEDGTVAVWSVETGEILNGPFEGHSDMVLSLSFSPDPEEYRFASGSADMTIRIWKLNGESITCRGHTDWVRSVCFSPNGKHVASSSVDKTIRVWDSRSGLLPINPLQGHTQGVTSVCYLYDGTRIVSGSYDQTASSPPSLALTTAFLLSPGALEELSESGMQKV
ncbi:nucleotide-binding-oligomerization-domain like receptor [Pyrrhoderma noxium]|uniref:Nucleotide-binding-oligomerization-domain like receptor n=1 Tax=Pyrrhoderma noxium TaxID=2282107 RepID=A0A286UIM3_9AGAM|nr:nucleotide-binding-oligomerization-domain like receptor [Pyrrhoderma noxium]